MTLTEWTDTYHSLYAHSSTDSSYTQFPPPPHLSLSLSLPQMCHRQHDIYLSLIRGAFGRLQHNSCHPAQQLDRSTLATFDHGLVPQPGSIFGIVSTRQTLPRMGRRHRRDHHQHWPQNPLDDLGNRSCDGVDIDAYSGSCQSHASHSAYSITYTVPDTDVNSYGLQMDHAWQRTLDFLGHPPRRPHSFPPYRFGFPVLQVVLIENLHQLQQHAQAINEAAVHLGYVGFDLEHDMQARITHVQLSVDHVRAYVFNITSLTIEVFLHNEHICGILESPAILKAGVGITGMRGLVSLARDL